MTNINYCQAPVVICLNTMEESGLIIHYSEVRQ